MAKEENNVAAPAEKSPREKILELQQSMAGAQVDVAKQVVDFIAGIETEAFIEGLRGIHAGTIPGSQLDQTIGQLINVTAQTGQISAQLYQQMVMQQQQSR